MLKDKVIQALSKELNKQDSADAEKWFIGTIADDKAGQPMQVKKELV